MIIEKTQMGSWLNLTHKGSMPWGVQARKGTRPNTPSNPPSDHESSTTTAIACADSTSSLDKNQQYTLYLAPPLQRSETSFTLEVPGSTQSGERETSTDTLQLYDSPLIVPMKFPSPPAKPPYLVERYTASQVTPPCLSPATPEPIEPRTPTLDTPATGRFENANRSYPSPIQAGFRTPSSKYSAETQARKDVPSSQSTAARTLTFDTDAIPSSDASAIRSQARTNSFGTTGYSNFTVGAPSPLSNRTHESPRDVHRGQHRNFSYGLDRREQKLYSGVSQYNADVNIARLSGYGTPNDTPNLSLSDLVSSPPSVDTGADYNTVNPIVITPEDRHFPNIPPPPRPEDDTWTPPGVLGIGEGFGGGPQRDERGKRIDSRRWRLVDPLARITQRTAADVYTNDDSNKSKIGFKERFSQSVLNLLGESNKGKRRASKRNLPEAESNQWPRKSIKAEKRRSVNDLLGPPVQRAAYEWRDSSGRQREMLVSRARRLLFGRPDRNQAKTPGNQSWVDISSKRSPRNGSAFETRQAYATTKSMSAGRPLPFSPSMPALSTSLHGRSASDVRIQTWLNTSQAALSESQHSRYDFRGVDKQGPPRANPTALTPYSVSKNRVFSSTGNDPNGLADTSRLEANSPVDGVNYPARSRQSQYFVPLVNPAPVPEATSMDPIHRMAGREGRRGSIRSRTPQHDSTANVDRPEKQQKRRTSSISKFTSWLGIRRSSSSKTLDQGVPYARPDNTHINSTISQSSPKPRPNHYRLRTKSSTRLPDTERQTPQADSASKNRRRSGSDWLESIVRRRSNKTGHPTLQGYPEIVLLSAEHLPPPTINEHGFLQSSPSTRSEVKLSETYLALHGIRQDQQPKHVDDLPFISTPFEAVPMERDLSRLTEADEEGAGQNSSCATPAAIQSEPLPVSVHAHKRKPTPPVLEPFTATPNALTVPHFESENKQSKRTKRYPTTLSIGSMSSMSTGITDGDEPVAIISAVLSSPVHEDLPLTTAPTVARAVSLDLNALTADERQAVGLGSTTRIPRIPSISTTYTLAQAV
ncbi:hypothetical protein QFC19_006827 [Naganishia cerealis]|uniref:Uncharacterized protein n=1 Tax=Naganishia cerealis TaxID=610337 RepID=A0ACC2VD82_9TREE|nr:hypothetical protein QFC19_006827 [Naganishia cerealis]